MKGSKRARPTPGKARPAAPPAAARPAARAASGRGEARAAAPEHRAGHGIRVRATRLGYYGEERKRIGDVFTIRGPKEFSDVWMQTVDGSTPERVTSSQEALNRETHRVAREKAGNDNVGPDSGDGTNPIGDD